MSNTNGTLKNCGACKEDMALSAFSKKQWDRKKFRRCKACVENENAFQRPSKKDYQQEKKENLMVPSQEPAMEWTEEKPQVTPERQPLDPVALADKKRNSDKDHISNLEAMPAGTPVADSNDVTMNAITETAMSQILNEEATKKGISGALNSAVLSETTKSNFTSSSMEIPSEPLSVAASSAAATNGDENTVKTSLPLAKADKDIDPPPLTPEDQLASYPTHLSEGINTDAMDSSLFYSDEHFYFDENMKQWGDDVAKPIPIMPNGGEAFSEVKVGDPLESPSQLSAADAGVPTISFLEAMTPSRVEEMMQAHDAIFRAVFDSPNDQEDQYDDPGLLHRVSTEDVMEYEVGPIVNVEQEIYDLLHNPSSEPGILFVDSSESNDTEDLPSASSPSKRRSTEAFAPNNATSNNEEQASDANIEDTTTDQSSSASSPDTDTDLVIESIERDALDWDPSAMAQLSPTASVPSSPPVPPIEAEDDENENEVNQHRFGRMLAKCSSFNDDKFGNKTLVRLSCFFSILGLLLSAMLLPHNHGLLLAFAGVAVGSGGTMLFSRLSIETSRNDADVLGDAMAVDSLREPLLCDEDRQIISDEV